MGLNRAAIIFIILNWFLFVRKMALQSINFYHGEAVRHLIGRTVERETAVPWILPL